MKTYSGLWINLNGFFFPISSAAFEPCMWCSVHYRNKLLKSVLGHLASWVFSAAERLWILQWECYQEFFLDWSKHTLAFLRNLCVVPVDHSQQNLFYFCQNGALLSSVSQDLIGHLQIRRMFSGFQGSISFPVVFRVMSLGCPLFSGIIAENMKPDAVAPLERNWFGPIPTMLFF